MPHLFRILGAGVSAAATTVALAAPASAHSPAADEFAFALECDNGQSYLVTTNGNGEFTPAQDTASNTVFVPTSFGEFHGVVTDAETGEMIDEFTEPGAAKGHSGKARASSVTCTFLFEGTDFDPDLGIEVHFEASGTVVGFATPAR